MPRQRIIPPSYREGRIDIVGDAPLLMHADTLLDIANPLTREFKTLAGKSRKTPDDEMNLAKLEWLAGIYHDEEIGPYLPGANVKTAIAAAASRWKKGATVRRSLIVVEERLPLIYDGPRDLETLWDEGYRDVRGAVNGGIGRGRVTRTRPLFVDWALSATIAYDPAELSEDNVTDALALAQARGLGDYRPDFGTFTAKYTSLAQEEPARTRKAA